MRATFVVLGIGAICALGMLASSEQSQKTGNPGKAKLAVSIKPQHVADALRAVIVSHRELYADLYSRAGAEARKTMPTPCEMLRQGSEAVASKGVEYSYLLRSLQPLNKRNAPETDIEIKGIQSVTKNPESPFYSEELLGGRWYLTAVYPDTALNASCVTCHSQREDSPRKSHKTGDVMGGLVVRIALEL